MSELNQKYFFNFFTEFEWAGGRFKSPKVSSRIHKFTYLSSVDLERNKSYEKKNDIKKISALFYLVTTSLRTVCFNNKVFS